MDYDKKYWNVMIPFILAVLIALFMFNELSAQGITVNRKAYFDGLEGGGTPAYQDDVLECTSAGTAYISSTEVTGDFEFEIYKADASQSDVWLISTGVGAWAGSIVFRATTAEAIAAYRNGGNMCTTANSTISAGTWYTIKINIGTGATADHTFYLDDVAWTPSTGSNPYTEVRMTSSTTFGVDLDAGDKIRNVKINSSDYTDLEDFVGTGTGTFTFTDN